MKRIRISFKFSFLFIVTFTLTLDKSGITFLSLLACALHEAGHIAAVYFLEKSPIKITFSLKGISIFHESLIYEKLCLLAGPFVNFLLFLCYPVFPVFSAVNLVIGLINIIPIAENDGARLLHSFLLKNFSPRYVFFSEKVIGSLFLIPVILLLFFSAVKNAYNYTLLIMVIYLLCFLIEGKTLD